MTNLIPAAISSQLDQTGEERIHAAPYETVVRPVYVAPVDPSYVYALIDSSSQMMRSADGGLTWPDTIESGGASAILSASFVIGDNNRLTRDTSIAGRTSTDGSTFSDLTGDLSGTGSPMWHLWTGTEWLRRSVGGLLVSADGINYQARTIPSLGTPNIDYNAFAKRGDNIIFAYVVGATNRTIHSGDNGVTWAAVSTGANTQLVATANRFIGFVGSAGRVDLATTGANGTWTFNETTLPTSSGFVRVAAYNSDLNRVVVVTSVGSFYYSDDEGTSWTGPYSPLGGALWQDAVSVRGMIHAYGRFILQMHDTNTSESKVFTSDDGITWTQRLSTPNFLGTLAAFEEAP